MEVQNLTRDLLSRYVLLCPKTVPYYAAVSVTNLAHSISALIWFLTLRLNKPIEVSQLLHSDPSTLHLAYEIEIPLSTANSSLFSPLWNTKVYKQQHTFPPP